MNPTWVEKTIMASTEQLTHSTTTQGNIKQGSRGLGRFLLAGFVALMTATAEAQTQALSALDIMTRANLAAFYPGDDGRAEARMKIVDNQGREQVRQFVIMRKDLQEGGDQWFYVLFSRPAEVNRTAFLVKKQVRQEDDRWLYLPGLDLVKRISAGDKRTSFVGSHFYYEDISGRNINEDEFALMADEKSTWVIQGTPKNPQSVEFSRYRVTVDKGSFLPLVAEYDNAQGKAYRRAELLKVEMIEGIPTGTVLRMTDLDTGGYTLTQMRGVRYNLGIPEAVFTERSLRAVPREWTDLAN